MSWTKEEFRVAFAEYSLKMGYFTQEQLDSFEVVKCSCYEEDCPDWKMLTNPKECGFYPEGPMFKKIRDEFNVTKDNKMGDNSVNSMIYTIGKLREENKDLKRRLETDRRRFQVYANLAKGIRNELKEYKIENKRT